MLRKGGGDTDRRKKYLTGAVMLLFLAFWLYLAYCVPYTHDDWDWGLDVGLRQWLTASLNNRYVGSFFVILMTRSALAKVLILGGGMFAIPLLLALLAAPGEDGERRPFLPLYLAANLLMLLLPPRIWRQSCGWVSGFANYGVSVVAFLGWLLLLRGAFQGEAKRPWPWAAALLVYTFALGLFVETQSAVDLLIALALLVYALKTRKGRLCAASTLAGAVLGCIVIFLNPLYGELAASGQALGGIRNLSFPAGSSLSEIIAALFQRFFGYLLPLLFQIGLSFSLLLALISLLALWRGKCRPLCLLAAWPAVYGVLMAFFRAALPEFLVVAGGIVSLAIPLFSVALSGGSLSRRLLRLGALLAGLAVVAPMALVLDVGGRIYVLLYVLTALVALDLAAPLLHRRAAVCLCALLAVAGMLLWSYCYTQVAACSALRKELILAAVERGDKEVAVPTDRYEVIEWYRNPISGLRVSYYKQFYGVPQDLHIVYLAPGSYEHWPDVTQADRDGAADFPDQ